MTLFAELKRRNVLRVAAAYVAVSWLLIQVVETLFPVFGLSDAAIRTVVILLAIGFIPAVISAWAFELTPEGLVRDAEVDRAAPSIKASTKRLDRIVMVALALAVGFFAFDKFMLDPARDLAIAEAAKEDFDYRGKTYTPTVAGTDNVAITLNATAISGSPFTSTVSVGAADPTTTTAVFPAGTAGAVTTATVAPPFDATMTTRQGYQNITRPLPTRRRRLLRVPRPVDPRENGSGTYCPARAHC
mgnify:CR=1 FL=1